MKNYWFVLLVIIALFLCIFNLSKKYPHPIKYHIENFPLVEQPDHISCGPTSVLMVVKYYFTETPTLDYIKMSTKTEWIKYNGKSIGMTSPDYIVHALKLQFIHSVLRTGDLDRLKYYVSKSPVIVLLRSGKYTWHYVVVIGYDNNNITIADPGGGVEWDMPVEHFLGSWSFATDMRGDSQINNCPYCKGTGRWASEKLGPISLCEVCVGTGKEADFIQSLLLSIDVSPFTMITTEKS